MKAVHSVQSCHSDMTILQLLSALALHTKHCSLYARSNCKCYDISIESCILCGDIIHLLWVSYTLTQSVIQRTLLIFHTIRQIWRHIYDHTAVCELYHLSFTQERNLHCTYGSQLPNMQDWRRPDIVYEMVWFYRMKCTMFAWTFFMLSRADT